MTPLQPQVFDLLEYLIRNRTRVVSKDDLMVAVWGGRIVSESALTTRINAARAAIGDSGEAQRLIRTLPRKGVRFVAQVNEDQPLEALVKAVAADWLVAREAEPKLPLPDRPSVAVLPFENLSGDPEQEYFSDGMVDDIITGLSRIKWLFVIARNSSFIYKGRAAEVKQVEANSVCVTCSKAVCARWGSRINGQLIDTATGAHVWAERYDRMFDDIFAFRMR